MVHDKWEIRWKELLHDTYAYGSKIQFQKDGSVSFCNQLMPPGSVIHRWYAKTNYQMQRLEPGLPLIDGERAYAVTLHADVQKKEQKALLLRIIFYDRYDNEATSVTFRAQRSVFLPPIKTYSYCIELVNGGIESFTFHSIELEEISREEFDEEQARLEKMQKTPKKGKTKRKKDKTAKR